MMKRYSFIAEPAQLRRVHNSLRNLGPMHGPIDQNAISQFPLVIYDIFFSREVVKAALLFEVAGSSQRLL